MASGRNSIWRWTASSVPLALPRPTPPSPSGRAPRGREDILDDIDDILDALSSEASFVAATAEDGGGVFESQALGAGAAADAFNRVMWSADATMGMTGSTRYGTAMRKMSANAESKPTTEVFGAFSYSTMQETLRTSDAAAVSLTGIASYSGGTRAINGSGKTYSGTMELQVRFKANSVSGVVSGLEDSDGLPWQHNFADVDRIVLDDATLQRNARWNNVGTDATVFYDANSGLLRPVRNQPNTFAGILLGRGADAGSEANGTWSIGTSGTSYLTGGFGVMHVGDTARPVPSGDDGSAAGAQLFSMVANATAGDVTNSSASIADGMLTVKGRRYGWAGRTDTDAPTYQALTDNKGTPDVTSDDTPVLYTAKFDLAALAAAGGAASTMNGPKWVDGVISTLTEERDLLSTLQGLNSADTQGAEVAAWQRVQDAVQFNLFGGLLPIKLDDAYGDLESEADAIDHINRVLDALSSNAKLEAALDPDGTGIFDHYQTDADDDNDTDTAADADLGNFRYYDSVQRRNEVVSNSPFDPSRGDDAAALEGTGEKERRLNGVTIGAFRGQREYKVISALGRTDFTRFGFWRQESTTSARLKDGVQGNGPIRNHGGPGTFAYSPLDPTNAGTPTHTGFPEGGKASYVGETVALQATTILTGTVRVDVSWVGDADATTAGTFDATVGMMSLTISDLASAAGDPLTHGGSDTDGSEAPGNEIADIVLGGFSIKVGAAGANANDLIVGTADTTDPDAVTYSEDATNTSARLRFGALGMVDNTTSPSTSSVKALFVGQGVDGPLGVIGTWTVQDAEIGRLNAAGTEPANLGTTIYGAFGAEAP